MEQEGKVIKESVDEKKGKKAEVRRLKNKKKKIY